MAALWGTSASGFEIATGNEELKLRFDNTLKYSLAARLKSPSPALVADVNMDDGDRNFRNRGLFSNRIDLLSEFDLTYRGAGFRISGAAWYDRFYNRRNDNDSPGTNNSVSVPFDEFTKATRDLHGRKAELLDAFVFGRTQVGDMLLTGRLGKYTLLYGESLFFGNNGIAAAQAPLDIVKLLSVPNTQFKELMRPVPQISGELQINPEFSVGGYYQFRWEKDRLPAVGSYFSGVDILDVGGERFLLGPGLALGRTVDTEAANSGQGGLQLRYRPDGHDAEYGFYAVQYHAKSPITLLDFANGNYSLFYPEDIKSIGASLSTNIQRTNVGVEVSFRTNMPLVPQAGSVQSSTGYPVGKTFHAQASWIALLHASPLWEGGTFLGEVAYHRIISVNSNEAALDRNGTRSASALRFVFTPQYYQVLNGVDIGIPIGLGYGLHGRSLVLNPGFSVEHGGDLSIGINGDYQKVWRFSLIYTTFLGKARGVLTPPNSPAPTYSYQQNLKDRDFISLSIQRTF
ncbi:MAG: DUF1302 domain-containing protein [Burkholderiaceae bacterium]|nr:DUF1302 domain-containing protein [Burkholderiaceae bacterium]